MSNSSNNYYYKYLKYKQKYILAKNNLKKLNQSYNLLGGINTDRIIIVDNNNRFNIDIVNNISRYTTVHIDEYYFKIICRMFLDERIGTLVISSKYENFREYNKILIYASQSELDFGRLVYKPDSTKPYYKGKYDYVQQTLIDLRLQKFINDNQYRIPHVENFLINNIYTMGVINDDIKTHIDDPTRLINTSPFNLFKDLCGKGQNKDDLRSVEEIYAETMHNLQQYSQELEKHFNIDEPKFMYNYIII